MLQHPTRIFKFKYALLIVLCMEPKQNLVAAKKNKGRSELPVPPIENHFERNTLTGTRAATSRLGLGRARFVSELTTNHCPYTEIEYSEDAM